MNPRALKKLDHELRTFLDAMFDGMGRTERRRAMSGYVMGLLLDGERKSIEPMAARLVDDPREIQAMRQRLQEAVSVSSWSDDDLFRRLALKVERDLPGIEALVVDDTGFPKKGKSSVGVSRQYAGCLGRTDNCQVATSLHLAGESGSACIAVRLYLPEAWTDDRARCAKVGVPVDVVFQKKWQIALGQLEDARRWGVRDHVVLADTGYGEITDFREGLQALGYEFVVGIPTSLAVWAPDTGPLEPTGTRTGSRGRPRTRFYDGEDAPVSVSSLAKSLGRSACRNVAWREGSRGTQSSRFGAVRVRTAHRHTEGREPGEEQWLLYEWPVDEPAPTKYWLSNLSARMPMRELVRLAKLRWRVERDYQEMKGELGLDHFEGRTWRGFHHHAALCAVAHAFLSLRRAFFPPEQSEVDDRGDPATPPESSAALAGDMPALPAAC
jgi:SRSO17 transposase